MSNLSYGGVNQFHSLIPANSEKLMRKPQANNSVKIKNMSFNNISAIYQQKSTYYRPEVPDQASRANVPRGKRNS
jgi:hypothetical protein